jgi:multiple sugar transport system permease protein
VPAGYGIARMRANKAAVVIRRITPGLSYLVPLFLLFNGWAYWAPCGRRSSSISW